MTYRVGNHHGVTICAEDDGHRCGRPGHDCARGHLVAVITNGDVELAERICAALNGAGPQGQVVDTSRDAMQLMARRVNAARPGVDLPSAYAVIQTLRVMGWQPKPTPCPTCTGPIRETVDMVCQTCGTNYGQQP